MIPIDQESCENAARTYALERFHPLTARWFARAIGEPTAVQAGAWPAIASGSHTLVSAPTGTGKTLSAFLVFIDRLLDEARRGTLKKELYLIYVSPLKSLAGDIRENLRRPLDGIWREERGGDAPFGSTPLDVGVRTGDTPQNERRRMIKSPPHILIITPESLYLMLTGKSGQSILRTASAIIIDELHALIDAKRGAHLMLSLARLDRLCQKPLQRIGLSATLQPLEVAAEYLSPDPVTIVAPKMRKDVSLAVSSPVSPVRKVKKDAVWQDIADAVFTQCREARSVIAFVEGRAYAEKLAYYVNQLGGEGFARTHHGSLSKEQRFEVERALRKGELRLLCATSSMELGIDVGDIDKVFQIGCPRTISSTMQRLGRAGHNPNRTSVMHIFVRAPAEALYSGLAAEVVRMGGVEYSRPPRLCLDVLAQHLVSMAADGGYDLDDVMEILPRAYPFRGVTRDDVRDVLQMLSGDYEHGRDIPVRPRVLYDRIHGRVDGDPYSRMLAVSAGGTIPDKGLYSVRTETGVKLGELDEEFVYEARKGDKFLLGSFAWQIADIKKDSVVVIPSSAAGARPPFWKGEIRGRALQTGIAYGEILRQLMRAHESGALMEELYKLGLDKEAAESAGDYLKRQLASAGMLPDDRTIVVEHFRDETGNAQMMVHSVFGRPVNEPLAILSAEAARRRMGANLGVVADDDGFLLFPYAVNPLPERLLQAIPPDTAATVLAAALPATPLFNMAFRYNAARALMMGMRKGGRQPLWVQRLRSVEMMDSIIRQPDHPLMRETKRECLEDYWDLPGVEYVLNAIRSGTIRLPELYLDAPTPMSMLLRRQTEAANMYDYAPTTHGVHAAVDEALNRALAVAPSPERLARASERPRLPQNESQLHSLMMIEGDLAAGELDVPYEWLEALEERGRARYIEPGLWIAQEHADEYASALTGRNEDARAHIARRLLRYRGGQTAQQMAGRYLWTEREALGVLSALAGSGDAVERDGLYYHAAVFDRALRETVRQRRSEIRTLPGSRYAAALASRAQAQAPARQRLEAVLKELGGQPYPAAWWESALLPARVGGYRPELLDAVLAEGNVFWRLSPDGGLRFHLYDDIDWDADMSRVCEALYGEEKVIAETLQKRGASFTNRLSDLFGGVAPHETLLRLAEKGIVSADSFVPVRQWLNSEKTERGPLRQRVKAHVTTLTSGRWELTRPLKPQSIERQLERAFARNILLCRETAQGLDWGEALKALRVWEYTARVRRGYFIEGMSGMQYIRDDDYPGILNEFEHPDSRVVWLPAVDPAQPWGKCLAHDPERQFLAVPGAAVALKAGVPVAVFEQQGKALRVFDAAAQSEALSVFVQDYNARRIYPALRRITVKDYPREAGEALRAAGFSSEMRDWVLYRG